MPLAQAYAHASTHETESGMRMRIESIVEATDTLRERRCPPEDGGGVNHCTSDEFELPPDGESSKQGWSIVPALVVATRVVFGALLEEVSCHVAMSLVERDDCSGCMRTCSDSSLVCCWTSGHAELLGSLLLLWRHSVSSNGEPSMNYALLPEPLPVSWCVDGLPNCAQLVDAHGPLGSNDVDGRVSGTTKLFRNEMSRMSQSGRITSMALNRCTDAGMRGWSTDVVRSIVKDSNGSGWIMKRALIAAITGMNAAVHPCQRLPWKQRASLARVIKDTPAPALLGASHVATRCACRLFLGRLMCNQEAEAAALRAIGHPVGFLALPPATNCVKEFQDALTSMCRTGRKIYKATRMLVVDTESTTNSSNRDTVVIDVLTECVNTAVAITTVPENGSDKKQANRPTVSVGHDLRQSTRYPSILADSVTAVASDPCFFVDLPPASLPSASPVDSVESTLNANWIMRSRPIRKRSASLISYINSIAFDDFSKRFSKVWRSFAARGSRLSRIDNRQHDYFASRNCVNIWQLELEQSVRLRVIRSALRCTLADVLSTQQAIQLLGLYSSSSSSSTGKAVSSCVTINDLSTSVKGQICLFARVASIKRQLLSFALDRQSFHKQKAAVLRRYHCSSGREAASVPLHADHVLICTQCKHICNTTVTDKMKENRFMDIGFRGVMSDSFCDDSRGVFKCAKRTSATDKCTMCAEQESMRVMTGGLQRIVGVVNVNRSMCQRDTRATFATPLDLSVCGVDPLLHIRLTGRVVFAFGSAFTHCAVCGGVTALSSTNRHGSTPCCMKCDWKTCFGSSERPSKRKCAAAPEIVCKYCGKVDLNNKRTKHAVYDAPLDDSEENANIPPPLRRLAFCSSHDKQWIERALRHLKTNAIIAHIMMKARPDYNADKLHEGESDWDKKQAKPRNRRRLPIKNKVPLVLTHNGL